MYKGKYPIFAITHLGKRRKICLRADDATLLILLYFSIPLILCQYLFAYFNQKNIFCAFCAFLLTENIFADIIE
jgi:hypothetical protein